MAKGIAFFPFAQNVDTYGKLVKMSEAPDQAIGLFKVFVAQGRAGQWLLHKVLALLGVVGPSANTLYVFIAMCCFVAVGVLLCRLWGIEGDRPLSGCVVGLFVIHPYNAEVFVFREMSITVGLALLAAVAGVVLAERHGRRWLLGWLLLILSMSLYQVALNFVVIGLIVLCLIEWSRSDISWVRFRSDEMRQFAAALFSRLVAIGLAVPAYLVLHKLSLKWAGVTSADPEITRSSALSPSEMPERALSVLRTVKYVFVNSEPLMPGATKVCIALMLLLVIGLLTKRALRVPGSARWAELLVAGALLFGASLAVVGILMGLRDYFVVDRTLSAVSVLVAGLMAIVGVSGGLWLRRVALAVAFVLLLSFVGVNNVVLAEQLRSNSRDRETANRMIMRLESAPAFPSVKKIAVIGRMPEYPIHSHTLKPGSDVNVSEFAKPWSKAHILCEVSGYRFADPSPQELERAVEYCRHAEPWPHAESVAILDDMAVICLSND
jgi:hypothetical protein